MAPVNLTVDSDCLLAMIETLQEARVQGLSDLQQDLEATSPDHDRRPFTRQQLTPKFIESRSGELSERHKQFLTDPACENLRQKKEELPMNKHRAQVIDMI